MLKSSRFRFTIIALVITVVFGVILAGRTPLMPRAIAQSPTSSIIVQLSGDPVVVARAKAKAAGQSFNEGTYRQQLIAKQDQFLARLTAAGINYKIASVTATNGPLTSTIQHRFNYVYNGIGLEVAEGVIPIIAILEDVAGVHPNLPVQVDLNRAVEYTGATRLYGTPARLTQFDTLNTGGIEGAGVNIAVIDTGVDWSHEMFGGDPTPPQFGVAPPIAALNTNKKVIYYMNFTAGPLGVGDDFGHGTHVAAIAAGYRGFAPGPDGLPLTADDVPVHGAAPQAKIMAYKVLTAAGAGVSTSIISAIEDAVQPRTITGQPKPVAHVINMSLGSQTAQGPDYPTSVAADNAAIAGAIVVASAGNSGVGDAANQAAGNGTVGGPGSGRHVITVAANNDPGPIPNDPVGDRVFDNGKPLDLTDVLDPSSINQSTTGAVDGTGKSTAEGQRTGIPANLAGGAPAIGNPIAQYYVFCGTVTSAADVPDSVAGRIAIARPSGAFATVANSIAAKGAAAVILARPDLAKVTVVNATVPTWSMQESDVRYLLDLLSSNDTNGVDPAKGALSEYPIRITLGQWVPAMATFSSRGPVVGYGQVKPDVSAPGVAILSATVAAGGVGTNGAFMFHPSRYISASGTSMSCPMTAGIAALIKQKNPAWTPSMVRAALVNFATNLRQADGTPVADGMNSILEQGGGFVEAYGAANAKALMGVGVIGPTGQPGSRSFEVLGQPTPTDPDFTPSYSFGVVPIANVIGTATISQTVTIYDISNGSGAGTFHLAVRNIRNVDQDGFRVSFTDTSGSPISSVIVPAGGSASFNVKTEANGEKIAGSWTQIQWYVTATRDLGRTPTPGVNMRMPFYYRAVPPTITLTAPSLNSASGTEVSGSPVIDINGSYSLSYSPVGSPAKFRIEEQKDGGAWVKLADVDAGQTTFNIADRGNGTYNYRVAGLFPVQYGLLKGPYSATQTVQVNRRLESDVTALIQTAISNVSLTGGAFEFDQTLKNTSASQTILPPLKFTITSIQSGSGTVRVTNADNSGNGVETPATFDYSNTVGTDRALTPGETSGAKHLKFSDQSGELFQFTAVVKGQFPDPAFSTSSVAKGSERKRFKVKIMFIADPQTGTVSVAGIE